GQTIWKGPVVAFFKAGNDLDAPKMKDMNLTTYRDAIGYVGYFRQNIGSMIDGPGSLNGLSRRVMEERTGKAKGVRINCIRDQAGIGSRQFVQVQVPKTHPVFSSED
ncbi:hypothetical protein BU23DRAFT_475571, partial [Bimuria novae-zelandiae CBS 107.79]